MNDNSEEVTARCKILGQVSYFARLLLSLHHKT